jgi:hypothetical protein
MKSTYKSVYRYGIHEIVRIGEDGKVAVVETNIRTKEKAEQACQDWERREREKSIPLSQWEKKLSQP